MKARRAEGNRWKKASHIVQGSLRPNLSLLHKRSIIGNAGRWKALFAYCGHSYCSGVIGSIMQHIIMQVYTHLGIHTARYRHSKVYTQLGLQHRGGWLLKIHLKATTTIVRGHTKRLWQMESLPTIGEHTLYWGQKNTPRPAPPRE